MKKILLILITFYTFSFSGGWSSFEQMSDQDFVTFYVRLINPKNKISTTPWGSAHGHIKYEGYVESSATWKYRVGGILFTIQLGYYDTNTPSCTADLVSDIGKFTCLSDGTYDVYYPNPDNGFFNEDGSIACNDGYSNNNGTCDVTPENSDGFNEDGTPDCSTGFQLIDGSCTNDPSTNPDGTCNDGYFMSIGGGCEKLDNPDGGDTGSGGSDDGDTGSGGSDGGDTGSGGSDGGDTGSGGSDGGDTGSGGSVGGDTGSGGSVGGDTGSGGSTGGDDGSDNPDGGDTGSSFTCEDGAPTQCIENLDGSIFCHCDRNCETVGYYTNLDGTCSSEPINNDDDTTDTPKDTTDLTNVENKLDDIDNGINTSNTFLGNIYSKISELVNIFSDDGTDTTYNERNSLEDSSNDFTSFVTEMKNSATQITTQVEELRSTIQNGLEFNSITSNNTNLQECLTVEVFGSSEIVLDFITPISILKPFLTILFQISMLAFVVKIGLSIVSSLHGLRE